MRTKNVIVAASYSGISMRQWYKKLSPQQRVALCITIITCLWVGSGVVVSERNQEKSSMMPKASNLSEQEMRLVVRRSQAQHVQRMATVQGQLKPSKDVKIMAQTSGEVKEVIAKEGQKLKAGDAIVQLDMQDRQERLKAAYASLTFREKEFEARRKLYAKGYESALTRARSSAELEQARADILRMKQEIGFTKVIAPFDGVVESIHVEVGDFGGIGVFGAEGAVARMVALDPMLGVGHISQADRSFVDEAAPIRVILADGSEHVGRLSMLAHVAEDETRSYPIEVMLDNPETKLIAGQNITIKVPLDYAQGHYIPSSALSLDDAGVIRVKTLDEHSKVRAHTVEILSEDAEGVWVSGLEEHAQILIAGHHYVTEGMKIAQARLTFEPTPQEALIFDQ
ncbi:MAG: efflux RND transporter periplasmic adaptor subunit [Alphaproteobacteria bacterium]|nr:MAG: efflux RND transporter periplasmic adaptor subunit [Alphaproteobacteria bacterium]